MSRRLAISSRAPLLALLVVSVLSLVARGLLLDEPCQSPCTQASQHTMIFDEAYYVNAARVIAGIRPPAGAHYADAPLGTDPNAEHPQGAKLIMAGAIELFGDGPFAWRIGSLLFGSIALLGMYALARGAGAEPWPAVGAAALLGADNLLLVHGRIGTLDIYAVAMMIWAAAAYVRGRPLLAGIVLGIATCFKEISPYLLFAFALLELGRLAVRGRLADPPAGWRAAPGLARLITAGLASAGTFVGLLAVMDAIATPYADANAKLITGGPFAEISHIITYGVHLTSPNGPQGIASYPWQWLIDLKPIVYLSVNPSLPGHQLGAITPVCAFLGFVSPPILALGLGGLLLGAGRMLARRRPLPAGAVTLDGQPRWALRGAADAQLALVAIAWFLGTWLPFALQSLVDQRTSYLYYMVIVMPGLYLAASGAALTLWRSERRWARATCLLWGLAVAAAAVVLYPFVAVF
jgi:hypothetical protein